MGGVRFRLGYRLERKVRWDYWARLDRIFLKLRQILDAEITDCREDLIRHLTWSGTLAVELVV